jgi:hypothetical protein
VRVISSFRGDPSGKNSFAAPSDVFVTNSGELFVCDTDNGRVVKLDRDLNFLMEFTKPNDATYTQSLVFMPVKVVADSVGRAYVLAKNVNKGLLKYENDGKFAGFYGAGEVTYRWSDYVWKTLSTKAQRAQLESFVPTEYDNVALDRDGFMYAVTSTFEEWSLMQDRAKPIRRLNALGKDILVKNGEYPPIGDLVWGVAAGTSGPSRFNDITVLDNDVYVASDQTRGRLFAYDNQGNLLFAFSGKGNVEGYFKKPSALEHVGRDLLVLDAQDCSLTVFTPTEYGKLVFGALDQYAKGDYDASSKLWSDTLRMNSNYALAYVGMGKAYLRQGRYGDSMRYFRVAWDDQNYSKAFVLYRKEWVEKNIALLFALAALALFAPLAIGRIRRVIKEVREYDGAR